MQPKIKITSLLWTIVRILTCGCRVARFCSAEHQKMALRDASRGGCLRCDCTVNELYSTTKSQFLHLHTTRQPEHRPSFGASARRILSVVRLVAGRGVGLDTTLSAGLGPGAHVGGRNRTRYLRRSTAHHILFASLH